MWILMAMFLKILNHHLRWLKSWKSQTFEINQQYRLAQLNGQFVHSILEPLVSSVLEIMTFKHGCLFKAFVASGSEIHKGKFAQHHLPTEKKVIRNC